MHFSIFFICLLGSAWSRRNGNGYSDSYVFLTVRNRLTGEQRQVCANYLQYKSRSIAETSNSAVAFKVAWWKDIENNTKICPLPVGAEKLVRYTNKAVALKYRIDDDGTSCTRQFNETTFRNASQFQISELERYGAGLAIFLVDEGRQFVTKWRDYLFSDFFDPYVNATAALPTFFLYSKVYHESVVALAHGNIDAMELRFHRPQDSPFDLSLLIIWLIAVGCVAGGGTWAFFRHRKGKDKSPLSEPNSTLPKSSSSDEYLDTIKGRCLVFFAKHANSIVILFLMSMLVTVLMLGFWFRPALVWFFNVMLVVFGSFSIYGCLNAIFSCLNTDKSSFCSATVCSFFPELGCISHSPSIANVLLYTFSLFICVTWFVIRKNVYSFILLDFINITLCLHILKSLRLPSLKWISTLMLCMFVYDAVMVFATPFWTKSGCSVMLEVATGGDCSTSPSVGYPVPPIDSNPPEKFPMLMQVMHMNPMTKCVDVSVEQGYRMTILGLGDIIIPGYLVTHCFTMNGFQEKTRMLYGIVCIIGYGVGLILTFVALNLMNMAQPALIYLVPGTLFPIYIMAVFRKEFRAIWYGVPETRVEQPLSEAGETRMDEEIEIGHPDES